MRREVETQLGRFLFQVRNLPLLLFLFIHFRSNVVARSVDSVLEHGIHRSGDLSPRRHFRTGYETLRQAQGRLFELIRRLISNEYAACKTIRLRETVASFVDRR